MLLLPLASRGRGLGVHCLVNRCASRLGRFATVTATPETSRTVVHGWGRTTAAVSAGVLCGAAIATVHFKTIPEPRAFRFINWSCKPRQGSAHPPTNPPQLVTIREATSEDFENNDRLVVFVLGSQDERKHFGAALESLATQIQQVMARGHTSSRKDIAFRYAVQPSEGPTTDNSATSKTLSDPIPLVLYCGQRKEHMTIRKHGRMEDLKKISDFMKAHYTKPPEHLRFRNGSGQAAVEHLSGDVFKARVLDRATPARPILVQAFETSCFVCFLMRPFINSVAALLRDRHCPLEIKRINVEENDFPPGMPVCRATPTFFLYSASATAASGSDDGSTLEPSSVGLGTDTSDSSVNRESMNKENGGMEATPTACPGKNRNSPVKWAEFRPSEVIGKMEKMPQVASIMTNEDRRKATLWVGRLANRFQLISSLALWKLECAALTKRAVRKEGIRGEEETTRLVSSFELSMDELSFPTVSHLVQIETKKGGEGSSGRQQQQEGELSGRSDEDSNDHTASLAATADTAAFKAKFNSLLADVMAEDMLEADGLDENLETLSRKLDEAERDAIALARYSAPMTLESVDQC